MRNTKIPLNSCTRRRRCLMWHVRVAVNVGDNTHRHTMKSPHQQNWKTRQETRTPRHMSGGPRRTPRQRGRQWKNVPSWHCPGKTWRRGIHVPSTCHYVDIMLDHVLCDVRKKRVRIRHVLTCLRSVFLLSDMTNFRWRPWEGLRCQSERALPFFLTSQKTGFSYSGMWKSFVNFLLNELNPPYIRPLVIFKMH
jgi:hypothetical protein